MKIKDMILCAIFAALIAVGAILKIPIPEMPITLQTMFVTMAGLVLGAKRGAISVAVYVALGLLGVPVFVRGGGIGYVLQPTFGYLLGFIAAAYMAGIIMEKSTKKTWFTYALSGVAALLAVYALGLSYYYIISQFYLKSFIGIKAMMWYCFLATFPGDVLMAFVSAPIAKRLREHL